MDWFLYDIGLRHERVNNVSNFHNRILTDQEQELVIRNCQWNCMLESFSFLQIPTFRINTEIYRHYVYLNILR